MKDVHLESNQRNTERPRKYLVVRELDDQSSSQTKIGGFPYNVMDYIIRWFLHDFLQKWADRVFENAIKPVLENVRKRLQR